MNEKLQNVMRERWQQAEALAAKLGLTKQTVFAGMPLLKENGLLDGILAGDAEAIAKALELRWCGYYGQKSPTKQAEEKTKREFRGNAGDVQLMIWDIKKIGNAERAKDAFERALRALE